jgi:hypothetical protein
MSLLPVWISDNTLAKGLPRGGKYHPPLSTSQVLGLQACATMPDTCDFDMKGPPQKAHVLKVWSPAGGTIERWLDIEEANLINVSIHWWAHSWMPKWRKLSLKGIAYSRPSPTSCFLATRRWAALPHVLLLPWCSVLPPAMAMEPSDHGLKPQRPGAKINPSSFELVFSVICHSREKWLTENWVNF